SANAEAAEAFIAHIKKYPNDPRAAEAYLKLGTAFARLEQGPQACKVFTTMKKKFPNIPDAVQQRADLEMQRLSCS
ncbi:MAG: tol-pal system protein YbgF, partial [Pseudomonadota bacterium]